MFNGYLKKKTVVDAAVLFACLGIVLFLAKLYHPENLAMHKVAPHPFFIISIVYSAYHGLRFSILSSVVTAILYYALLAYQTDFQEVESIFTGAYLVLPLTTSIVSIVIGDIRQRTWARQQEKEKELSDAQEYVNLLKKEREGLDRKLKEIKSRLVTKLETTRSMYDKARGFYSFNQRSLLKAFRSALKEDCSIEEVSVYLIDQGSTKFTKWEPGNNSESPSSSIPQELENILLKVSDCAETFSVRDFVYKQEFSISEFPCLVASPILKEGELFAIAVVHKMPFLKLTATNLNILRLICAWFGEALEFSDKFNSLRSASLINRDDYTHRFDFFDRKRKESAHFARNFNLDISSIEISWTTGGFKEGELLAFKNLLVKTLEFLFDDLEITGEGSSESHLRILLFRSREKSDHFLSELRLELSKIREHSGLDRFPELVLTYNKAKEGSDEENLLT